MIKRTIYFGNPAYLSLKNEQLLVKLPEIERNNTLPENFKQNCIHSIPIEDIGVLVLDNKQITLTQGLLEKLLSNNCAVITCDSNRLPTGLLLPLSGNTLQSERFDNQINASLPLKKQLWQQTVAAKIDNQAYVLRTQRQCETGNMLKWSRQVRSGDPDNLEARAAAYYWANMFPQIADFVRDRDGVAPNNLLNYGYAILRAIVARALVATGLLPTSGIHHHNRYNAYCLADDIMEPYRPFVDKIVCEIVDNEIISDFTTEKMELTKETKAKLLQIPVIDVIINEKRSPLMVAVSSTTASLNRCYAGEARKINYPCFEKS
ncbi:MAG: type II CRISPR-associated endonuclease Cas1 [Bacteroidales bacterium]|jgi:CRISPR-associated protein Cas1|nr:type II CRISPR-associated endonuclease Cas1 [Bacteroidales bacterium]